MPAGMQRRNEMDNNNRNMPIASSLPLVSVVIPVYNVERYLVECLDSIAAQDYPNKEIIAIDDGSTDGSLAELEKYASQHRGMTVIHQENSGAGIARNKGAAEAKGKYVLFVDPDDALEQGTLRELIDTAEAKGAEIVLFAIARYDAELKTVVMKVSQPRRAVCLAEVFAGEDIAPNIYTTFSDGPSPCNKLFNRQFIVNHGLEFQSLPRVNDLSFSYSALALAKRICVIDKAYYKYRTSRKGSSQNTTDKDPAPVCYAYHRLMDVLSRAGVFHKFSVSFYKAFYSSCSYTFRQMKCLATAKRLFELLHSKTTAAIAGAKLERASFDKDNEFALYMNFWSEKSPYRLMLNPVQRKFANDMPTFAESGNRKVLGVMCSSLRPGGIERVVTHLVPIFARNGYDVVLMTSGPATTVEYELPDGCIRVTTGRDSADGSRYDCIRAAILKYGIDMVIVHEYYMLTVGKDIAAIHSAGAKAIVHHHSVFSNMYLRENRERSLLQLLKAYTTADAMITLSDVDAFFFSLMGCNVIKITDPVPDIPPPKNKKPVGHTLIWVARFVEGKRPLDAVRIFELVLQRVVDAKLVMLGDGETAQIKLVNDYLSDRPDLRRAVFLKGHQSDVFEFERDADVFLTTTKFDGFSLSVIEAKAMGLPVVSYSMPYLETVKPGTGVLSVPQGDIAAAADAVMRIFSDTALYRKLSRESRASYEHFATCDQWEAYAKLFGALGGATDLPKRKFGRETMKNILSTLLDHVDNAFGRILRKSAETDAQLGDVQKRFGDLKKCVDLHVREAADLKQLIGAKDKRIADLELRVKKWTHETTVRNQLIAAKDKRIADLELRVKKWTHATTVRNQLIAAKDKRIDDLEVRVKKWTHETTVRNQLIAAKDKRIDDLEVRAKKWTHETTVLNQSLANKDVRINELDQCIKQHTKEVADLKQLIDAKDKRIADLELRVKKWTHETTVRNQLIAAKDKRIADLELRVKKWTHATTVRNQLIAAKDKRIDDLEVRVKKWTHATTVRNQLIAAKDKRIDDLKLLVNQRMKDVASCDQLIAAKDARIEGYVSVLGALVDAAGLPPMQDADLGGSKDLASVVSVVTDATVEK